MGTWLEDIITAMGNLGGIAHYSDLYEEVERIRQSPLPPSWKAIIRRAIETTSSDSAAYGGTQDIFFSVEGLGLGIWGLRNHLDSTPKAADIEEPKRIAPEGNYQPNRIKTETYRILRDTQLARQLKLLHRNCCQLCDLQLDLGNGIFYSEAHHIKPLGNPHNGPDVAGNIIILCPNHHAQLDYFALPLSIEDFRSHDQHTIGDEYLDYHNEQYQSRIEQQN